MPKMQLLGLLLELDNKLSPHGFKKIDSPALYADFMSYLDRAGFSDTESPSPIKANDHVWVRVERDEYGTIHHAICVIPFNTRIAATDSALYMHGAITPEPGGDQEDAAITSGSHVFTVGQILALPDRFFASALKGNAPSAAPVSDTGLPTRPDTAAAAGGFKHLALKGLRAFLAMMGRKP